RLGQSALPGTRRHRLQGCSELDQPTRTLLWRSKEHGGGFEDTLADLTNANNRESKKRLDDLTAALVGMFNAMGQGFTQRRTLEFQTDIQYMVKTFLTRFNAIFTLNQDTLLELHYLGDNNVVGAAVRLCETPGLKLLNPMAGPLPPPHNKIAPKQPDPDNF